MTRVNSTKPTFVIRASNMSPEYEKLVKEETEKAMNELNTDLSIATKLRSIFENREKNSVWHCVVGRKFAANLTYESGFFIYYYVGAKAFLLFKST